MIKWLGIYADGLKNPAAAIMEEAAERIRELTTPDRWESAGAVSVWDSSANSFAEARMPKYQNLATLHVRTAKTLPDRWINAQRDDDGNVSVIGVYLDQDEAGAAANVAKLQAACDSKRAQLEKEAKAALDAGQFYAAEMICRELVNLEKSDW